VALERPGVRAVLAVDRDALAERYVAEDRVAGHGPAALGEPERDVVDALDLDPVGPRRGRRLRHLLAAVGEQLLAGPRLDGRLALLEPLHDLVDDYLRRDLRLTERDVELLALLEAHVADHVREQRRAGDPLGGQPGALEVLLKGLAAGPLRVLPPLALEPG